jgi:glycosyltransferase involved in cell wall biosynthesis
MYVVTVDWFFCSHFLDRALAARDAGFEVLLAARLESPTVQLEREGITTVSWNVSRDGISPLREVAAIRQLVSIYRHAKPDIVHHVAIKPIVYGTLAALLTSVPHIVNAPVGMGFAFTAAGIPARLLKPLLTLLLRMLLGARGARVIFENADDRSFAVQRGLVPESSALLIRGAGVDLTRFQPSPEPKGPVRVALIARMLKEKGVEEFVAAARQLRREGLQAEWLLVGAPDSNNRGSLTQDQLMQWHNEGVVRWLGERRDIERVLAETHIVALPSYREGLPKALLEAMAAAKPVITTDVPGCREVCLHGVNGLLVRPRDAAALAAAMRELIEAPEKRSELGLAGRRLAEQYFSTKLVQRETLALYQSLAQQRT